MGWNLERQDLYLIVGILALPLIAASLTFIDQSQAQAIMVWTGKWIQVPAVVTGIAAIYLAQRPWDAAIGRGLFLTGIGFTMILLVWTPHEVWHLAIMPTWLGISEGAWLGFYHGITVGMTFLIAYGYYVFWLEGKQ